MNLVAAVTNILLRRVTEEEAKQFALDNYGVLCAYIRNQYVESVMKVNPAPKGKTIKSRYAEKLNKFI